jgi:hypothetical protein
LYVYLSSVRKVRCSSSPVLGGGFGPGYVVAGGYDFVGDSYTGGNTPVPDSDPMDR